MQKTSERLKAQEEKEREKDEQKKTIEAQRELKR